MDSNLIQQTVVRKSKAGERKRKKKRQISDAKHQEMGPGGVQNLQHEYFS